MALKSDYVINMPPELIQTEFNLNDERYRVESSSDRVAGIDLQDPI